MFHNWETRVAELRSTSVAELCKKIDMLYFKMFKTYYNKTDTYTFHVNVNISVVVVSS